MFSVHEDTVEELLQNLMEHSTGTLYISDDSDDESELHLKGKENIPPERLAELLAAAPVERAGAKRTEKATPQRRGARREALREILEDDR